MSRKLFNNIFSLRKSRSIGGDGSSRRGRRLATESVSPCLQPCGPWRAHCTPKDAQSALRCPLWDSIAPALSAGPTLAPHDLDMQDREENSVRDSSTHSALFDLELSTRGPQGAEREAILASLQAEDGELREPSIHRGGTLQRVIYLGRPLMEFELDVSGLHSRQAVLGAL
jgi:hypothetical protein